MDMWKFLKLITMLTVSVITMGGVWYFTQVDMINTKQGVLHLESTEIKQMIRFYTIKDDFLIDIGEGKNRHVGLLGFQSQFEANMEKAIKSNVDGHEVFSIPTVIHSSTRPEIVVLSGNVPETQKAAVKQFAKQYIIQKSQAEGTYKVAIKTGENTIAEFIQQAKIASGQSKDVEVKLKVPKYDGTPVAVEGRAYSLNLPAGSIDSKWKITPVPENKLSRYSIKASHAQLGKVVIDTLEDKNTSMASCKIGASKLFDSQRNRYIYFMKFGDNQYNICFSSQGWVHEAFWTGKGGDRELRHGLADALMIMHGLHYDRHLLTKHLATIYENESMKNPSNIFSVDGNAYEAWVNADKSDQVDYLHDWLKDESRAMLLNAPFSGKKENVLLLDKTPDNMETNAANRFNFYFYNSGNHSDLSILSFGGYSASSEEYNVFSENDYLPASLMNVVQIKMNIGDNNHIEANVVRFDRYWTEQGRGEKYWLF